MRSRRSLPRLFLLMAVPLVLAACQSGTSEEPQAAAPAETPSALSVEAHTAAPSAESDEQSFAGTTPAPEFPPGLDWLNTDRPLTLEELQGKVVLLDFWTYGCINCMHNFPGLKRLEQEYADELVVIGVHSAKFDNEGDTENIRQIILRYGLEHPVVNDNQFVVWNTWGVRAWPTLVLIDPLGNVVGGHSGEGVYAVFQPVIQAVIDEFDEQGLVDRTPLELRLEREGLPSTVLSFPGKVLADPERERIFVADTNHHRIVQAGLPSGTVQAVFGSGSPGFADGAGTAAQFYNPQGMALSDDGATLYVADVDNHAVRAIDLASGQVITLAGTGVQAQQYPPAPGIGPEVELSSPWDLALDGDQLYIAMAGSHQIWRMGLNSGDVEAFAGNGYEGFADGARISAELAQPSGLTIGPDHRLFFADAEGSAIRWVGLDADDPAVGTLIGSGASLFDFGDQDGIGTQARIQHPLGITSDETYLYIADTYNSKIKLVEPASSEITTLWGSDRGWRDGNDPLFYEPGGLDLVEGVLYVADTNNHAVRMIELDSGEAGTLVLSGIEQFDVASAAEADPAVVLPAAQVGAGPGTVTLNVEAPAGYKFNDLAPTVVRWEAEGGVVADPAAANYRMAGPSFPVQFEFEFITGSGTLTADLSLYYCEAEKQELCLIDQVRLTLPLEVGTDATTQTTIEYRIPAPELPGG